MSREDRLAQLEDENRRLRMQLALLNAKSEECLETDIIPRDIRLLTELEHLETLGKNFPNGCLFRFHIETDKLENSHKQQQWLQHIYLSYASSSWETICNTPLVDAMQDITPSLMKIYPLDRVNVFPLMYKSFVRCTTFKAEVRYYYSDTETRWLQILMQPYKDGKWVVCNGFIFDITDLKQTEINLIAEKKRLQMLGDNLPDGTLYRLVFNRLTEKKYMEYVSARWERITGVSSHSVLEDLDAFHNIVHPDDLQRLLDATEISKKKRTSFEIEIRINYKGYIRWLHISSQPYKSKDMVMWDGIMTNITRRKKIENELAKHREELEYLIKERTEELEVTNDVLAAANDELANKNNQLQDEIAERMKIMQQLENSEIKMRNFIQQSLEGILIFDHQGIITEWNRAMEKITGLERKDVLGSFEWDVILQLYPDADRNQGTVDGLHKKRLAYMRDENHPYLMEDMDIYANDGNIRHVRISTFPIKMKDFRSYGCIIRDITRQRRADIELSQYRANLEQMVEMKTRELTVAKEKAEESDHLKSAFLANMSHEVRTPLNAISSLLSILAGETQLPDNIRECIDIINNSSEQLLKLIDDILDTAKIEAGQMDIRLEPFCIDDFMGEMYILFSQQLQTIGKKHISLEIVKTNTENCIVSTDPIRLMQIVHNLLSNAVKFTETGYIRFGYRVSDNNMLEFFVEDTGIGIPESHLNLIFQSFRQLELGNNRRYGGTGLGLHISQQLARLMGGDMYVKSTEGKGSTFFFTIVYNPL